MIADILAQSTGLGVNGVLALLSLIAAIDVAQFGLSLKHERRLTKIELKVHKEERRHD